MIVLVSQTWKDVAFERVVLGVLHAVLDLAFVTRRIRLGRHERRAIMPSERLQLRMKLRIVPIGLRDGRFQVVDDELLRHAAEMLERILQNQEEVVRRLPPHGFAVSFA